MLKKVICVLLLGILLICSGCHGTAGTGDADKTGLPTIKDKITDLNSSVFSEMAINYLTAMGTGGSFAEDDSVAFERAYNIIKCGVYSNGAIRPELRQYYDASKDLFTIPSDVVDEYVLGKFNTAVDHSKISDYNPDGTYTFRSLFGEFRHAVSICDGTTRPDSTVSFDCKVIGTDMRFDNYPMYSCTFTIRFEDGEYRYVAFDGLENEAFSSAELLWTHYGMEDADKTFGEPLDISTYADHEGDIDYEEIVTRIYSGVECWFIRYRRFAGDAFSTFLNHVEITRPDISPVRGIHVGDTLKTVLSAFPDGNHDVVTDWSGTHKPLYGEHMMFEKYGSIDYLEDGTVMVRYFDEMYGITYQIDKNMTVSSITISTASD